MRRQLLVHQQIGDLFELAGVGDVENVVAAVVQVVARPPTVHSAVLPAVTPDSATDFFGLNPVAGVLMSTSLMVSSLFPLGEQLVELLLRTRDSRDTCTDRRASACDRTTFFCVPSRRIAS